MDVSPAHFEPQHKRKWTPQEIGEARAAGRRRNRWFHLTHHKRPSALATTYDILAGAGYAVRLVHQYEINVLHARAHVPDGVAMLAEGLTRVAASSSTFAG